MAGIQAPGVGSGLDIATLVEKLVAAERAPLDQRIARQRSAATTEISALASLKSGVSTLRDALSGLRSLSSFAIRSATSSNTDIFTASADTTVLPGTYDIEVVNLAAAHRLASGPFAAGRDAVVGTGTLTITYGTTSFDVPIDATHNTLTQIRDAINTATGNEGVSASIVNEVGGSRLVMTARSTGIASTMTVTQAGGDGGLAALVFNPALPLTSTMIETPAANSLIRVNGYDFSSASDTVTGAVDGLTINLKKAAEGTEYKLTVANDTNTAAAKINKFVADYNALSKLFSSLQSYDPTTRQAGPMLGNAFVRGLQSQVRSDVANEVTGASGTYTTLASIGITSDTKGLLTVDNTKLTAALSGGFDSVASVFTASDGVAARMYDRLHAALASDAQLTVRNESLAKLMKNLEKDKETVDTRIGRIEARYRAQFTVLDALLTKMQTTSSFLSQQLSAFKDS
jgi:flagellar hook-associated protein 2